MQNLSYRKKKFLFQRQVSIFWSTTKLSILGILLSHVEHCFRQCQNSRWLLPSATVWATDTASLKQRRRRPWTHSTSIYVTAPVRHEHVQKRKFWKVSWKVFGPVNNYPKEGRKSTLSPGLVHPTPLPPGILRKCLWSLKTLNEPAGKMSSNTSLKREKAFKAKTEVSMSTDLEG